MTLLDHNGDPVNNRRRCFYSDIYNVFFRVSESKDILSSIVSLISIVVVFITITAFVIQASYLGNFPSWMRDIISLSDIYSSYGYIFYYIFTPILYLVLQEYVLRYVLDLFEIKIEKKVNKIEFKVKYVIPIFIFITAAVKIISFYAAVWVSATINVIYFGIFVIICYEWYKSHKKVSLIQAATLLIATWLAFSINSGNLRYVMESTESSKSINIYPKDSKDGSCLIVKLWRIVPGGVIVYYNNGFRIVKNEDIIYIKQNTACDLGQYYS